MLADHLLDEGLDGRYQKSIKLFSQKKKKKKKKNQYILDFFGLIVKFYITKISSH